MSQAASRRKTTKPAPNSSKGKTTKTKASPKAKKGRTSASRMTRNDPPAANEAVRERIVTAALSHFAVSGFHGTAITQIARDVGIASPLIYYYFEDKDALWRAAADYAIRDWSQNLRTIEKELSDADPLTVLKVQLRRFLYFSAQHREFSRLIINEAGSDEGRMEWLIEQHIKPMHEAAARNWKRAADAGIVRELNPAFLHQFLIGGVSHFMNGGLVLGTIYGVNPREDKTVDAFADFLIDLLFNGVMVDKNAKS